MNLITKIKTIAQMIVNYICMSLPIPQYNGIKAELSEDQELI
jgi:hypothetical protein